MKICSNCKELSQPVDVEDKGYCEEVTYECPYCGNIDIEEVPK